MHKAMSGWIKIHRKFLNWEWFNKSEAVHLFMYLILKANHKEGQWQGIDINKGQFITSYGKISVDTGISLQTIRTLLKKFEKTNEINIQTTNKYSVITICKYDDYQTEIDTTNNQLTNNQQSTNKQLTTNKNNKNKEEENINIDGFVMWFNQMLFKHRGKEGNFKKLSKTDINNLKQLKQLNFDNSDWEKVFITMSKNQWVMDNKMCTPSHYLRNDNFQKYLNQYEQNSNTEFNFAWV